MKKNLPGLKDPAGKKKNDKNHFVKRKSFLPLHCFLLHIDNMIVKNTDMSERVTYRALLCVGCVFSFAFLSKLNLKMLLPMKR